MLSEEEFTGLCRRLYRSLRDGEVDRETAFDLSAHRLAYLPRDDNAARVAALAMADDATDDATAAGAESLAAAARALLDDCFEPSFADEPGWLPALEEALESVKADLRATGLPDAVRLYTWEGTSNVAVDAWAANSNGVGIYPSVGRDPVHALIAVADDAQDAVMHSIWGAWPTCPAHRCGVHPREREGTAVWWCSGGGGHVAARIGHWASDAPA